MNKGFGYLIALVAFILVVFIFFNRGSPLPAGNLGPLSTEVRSFDGHAWLLETLKGKPMVVNFWATWCPPCLEELPVLSLLSRKYQDKVHFIGLAVDSPAREVAQLVQRFALFYPMASVDYQALEAWKAHSLPTTYVLDAAGKIVWSEFGTVNQNTLEKILVELIGIEPTTS